MSRILLLIVIWLLQATLVVVFANASWIEKQMAQERALVRTYLGPEKDAAVARASDQRYRRWFVESGWVRSSYVTLLPDVTRPRYGMEGLAPWWFSWIERRIDAVWWLTLQALYRSSLIWQLSPFILLLLVAGAVDGLTQRAIKRTTSDYPSGDRYTIARYGLLILAFLPLIYLSLPFHVHPRVVPIWGGLMVLATVGLFANAQHRV